MGGRKQTQHKVPVWWTSTCPSFFGSLSASLLLTLPWIPSRERTHRFTSLPVAGLPLCPSGNHTETSHCKACDNTDSGLSQTHRFPSGPSDVTELVAGFISLVSHCKLDSCGVAWTSAWFCEFSLPQRKLILKSRSNVYTVNKRPILFSQTWITTTRLFCFLKRKIQPKQANRQNL